MKQLIILICLFSTFNLVAQNNFFWEVSNQNQFYWKGGIGITSISSPFTRNTFFGGQLDVELIYNFKKPISIGLNSITGYGLNLSEQNQTMFYQQESLNAYYRLLDNRVLVGTGISLLNIWGKRVSNQPTTNRFSFGINFDINYKVWSNDKYNLHLKAFRHGFFRDQKIKNLTGIGILIGNQF